MTSSRLWSILVLIPLTLLLTSPASAQSEKYTIQINPGSLNSALKQLAEQASVQVVYESEVVRGIETAGFSGEATLQQALDALLAGTALKWRALNDRTVAVERKPRSDDEASAPSQPESVAEEIVVTAQLREQDIRDVPVSVTVMSGETIEREGIVSIREIARQTPGFTGSTFNESEPILAIRGATNTFSQAGTSKPVGVFVDGVYISRNSASTFDLFDLDRVEILRGPQGTLFGRNVTAGAIVLTTAPPAYGEPKGRVEANLGNFGTREIRGLVGGTLFGTVAGKLSAVLRKNDGYGKDRLSGVEQNDADNLALRGQLSFPLGSAGLMRLIGEFANETNHGRTLTTISPAGADDGDIRTSEHNYPQRFERDIRALSGHLSWTARAGEIESITAFRQTDTFEDFAFSSTAFGLIPRVNPASPFQQIGINRDQPETFSQELRLISKKYGRFDYVAGAYYFNEGIQRLARTRRLGGQQGDLLRDQTFDQNVDTTSYAGYGDVHVALTDALDLNVGGRLTYDTKEAQVDFTDVQRPAVNFRSDVFEDSWTEFSPRVALTWRATPNVSVFGSVTEGFTAGGFGTEEDTPSVIGRPFDPETLIAYEIGSKTSWLADRLWANVTVYHQDYQDKQEGFLDPQFNFVIVNAAAATMNGAEIESQWRPTANTRLHAAYSYLDATYDEFLVSPADNRSGNFLSTSPEHSYSVGGQWTLPLARGGEAALAANYAWQDQYFTGSENRPSFLIDAYSLLDASVSYTPRSGLWRAILWGKNLADEEYVLIRSDFGVGGIGEHFGAPRTFGVRVAFDF
jgi:iron complex outermembrane receptor protein